MGIFDGTQPPAWLQEMTRQQPGQLGHTLGLALGGGILALQPDESGDGVKGYAQGLHEARLNEQDPNWKVKTKALEGAVVSNWARAATEWQSFDATNRDMAQWATQDLPALTKYQEDLNTNPNAVAPIMHSPKGHQALQQIDASQTKKATIQLKQDVADDMLEYRRGQLENASTGAKQALEDEKYFNKTLPTVKSYAERTRIRQLQKEGKTTEAALALEAAEKSAPIGVQVAEKKGEIAEKSEAQKQVNRVALENVRADNKEDYARLTADQKQDFEALRQQDRMELKKADQEGKVSIEKMRELSRTNSQGRTITRKEFVNRHFNAVFADLRKRAPNDEVPSETARKAESILSGAYYRLDRDIGPTPPKTDSKFKETQAAPEPAPAAPASTNKDPLGLFGK